MCLCKTVSVCVWAWSLGCLVAHQALVRGLWRQLGNRNTHGWCQSRFYAPVSNNAQLAVWEQLLPASLCVLPPFSLSLMLSLPPSLSPWCDLMRSLFLPCSGGPDLVEPKLQAHFLSFCATSCQASLIRPQAASSLGSSSCSPHSWADDTHTFFTFECDSLFHLCVCPFLLTGLYCCYCIISTRETVSV